MFLEWCWKKITNLVISARKCYLRYLHYWFYTVGVNIAHKKSSSWAIKWTLLTLYVLPLAQIHKPCFPGCNVAMLSFFFFFSPKASGIGVLLVIVLTDQRLHTAMCLCHGGLEVGTHYLDSNSQPAQIDSQQQLISNILTQAFLFFLHSFKFLQKVCETHNSMFVFILFFLYKIVNCTAFFQGELRRVCVGVWKCVLMCVTR